MPDNGKQDDQETVNFRAEEEALRLGEPAKTQAQSFLRTVGRGDTADLLDDDPANEDALGQLRDFGSLGEDLIGKLKAAGEIKARQFEEQEREIEADARGQRLAELRAEREQERRERDEEEQRQALDRELNEQLDLEENGPEGPPTLSQQDLELEAFSDAAERHDPRVHFSLCLNGRSPNRPRRSRRRDDGGPSRRT